MKNYIFQHKNIYSRKRFFILNVSLKNVKLQVSRKKN